MAQQQSACARVFALPELLQCILENMIYTPEMRDLKHSLEGAALSDYLESRPNSSPIFDPDEEAFPSLAACACVCSMWFREAIPLLWAHRSEFSYYPMDTLFKHIELGRRQQYADYIQRGYFLLHESGANVSEREPPSRELEDLVFPRLLGLRIDVTHGGGALPLFKAPNLAWVHFDPENDYYPRSHCLHPAAWPWLLEQVTVS